ncbi:hypothetical protein L914_03923 [Phytophthora nicotianae]|uniref:Uncharacterized protein n=2 Tax=Phytophthora nicotianae TaxID=4792 RepID=V9FN63_PHYNI|nr:hypothetical protein F443_04082 [Phytophthora nicotianae P1569]ETM52459.1 hypothetical protein L914_03923 [Phytophthora nicotianae]
MEPKKTPKKKSPTSNATERRCAKCKKVFSTSYSKKRHQKKKFDCSKRTGRKLESDRKKRR